VTSFAALIAFPASSGFAILAPDIVLTLLGPRWEQGITVLRIFCMFAVIDAILHVYDAMMLGMAKPHGILSLAGVDLAFLAASMLLFGTSGPIAMAIILLVRQIILCSCACSLQLPHHRSGLGERIRAVRKDSRCDHCRGGVLFPGAMQAPHRWRLLHRQLRLVRSHTVRSSF